MQVRLDYLPHEKFVFLSPSMTVCVVENSPEGDRQIVWQKHWRNKLEAIFTPKSGPA